MTLDPTKPNELAPALGGAHASSVRTLVEDLADTLELGALLEAARKRVGGYEIVHHWQQGEFHHDLVLRLKDKEPVILVVATNCNGGVKEVLCFEEVPERSALWHYRCPESVEFSGTLPKLLGCARTQHWFEPSELLEKDARSEYRSEFRERQSGGGWVPKR